MGGYLDIFLSSIISLLSLGMVGWCDVLGKLPVPGRPTIWVIVGQGALAVGAGGGCLDIFYSPLSFLSSLLLSGRRPDID